MPGAFNKIMKKIYILSLLLAFPLIGFASIDNDLRYGATGQPVTELQEFLIDKGFLTTQASGNFFSLTKSAVQKYQQSVGLPTTGFVGPMTREKINAELSAAVSEEEKTAEVVNTPSNDTSVLQKQLDSLMAQVQALIAEQKKTTDQSVQTTQAVQQVVQNTTPVITAGATQPVQVIPEQLKIIAISSDQSNNGQYFVASNVPIDFSKTEVTQIGVFSKDIKTGICRQPGDISTQECADTTIKNTLSVTVTGMEKIQLHGDTCYEGFNYCKSKGNLFRYNMSLSKPLATVLVENPSYYYRFEIKFVSTNGTSAVKTIENYLGGIDVSPSNTSNQSDDVLLYPR